MDTIKVPGNVIKALSITMPEHDARVYLNGIQVEWTPNGVLMITSDGHRLSVARISYYGEEFESFIIPCSVGSMVKKNKYNYGIINDGGNITLDMPNLKSKVLRCINEKFPNWRQLMPRVLTDAPARYNLKYMGDLDIARKLLEGDPLKQTLVMNGQNGAIDRITENFFVLLMPLKTKTDYIPVLEVEEWVR